MEKKFTGELSHTKNKTKVSAGELGIDVNIYLDKKLPEMPERIIIEIPKE